MLKCEEMLKLRRLIEWYRSNYPWLPQELYDVDNKFHRAIQHGCWVCKTYTICLRSEEEKRTVWLCPKCSEKEMNRLLGEGYVDVN